LKAASANAPATINSEPKIDGRSSPYSGKAFLKRASGLEINAVIDSTP
jgi:hypothetical protein